jgi:hypothetical protein
MISMLHRSAAASAALLITLALSSCGGDDGDSASSSSGYKSTFKDTPTSEQVVGCLKTKGKDAGFTVSEADADLDPIARRASDRAVAIDAGANKAIVIIESTEQEAGTIIDKYRSGPASERGGSYSQSGTIVIVDKVGFLGGAQRKAVTDCTKYGTKES